MNTSSSLRNLSRASINKYSLILVFAISVVVTTLFAIHTFHSHQRQVEVWLKSLPNTMVIHLIDSDHFSIRSKLNLLRSTELFDCFQIFDRVGQQVSAFGQSCKQAQSIEIKDAASETWGSYRYSVNYVALLGPSIVLVSTLLASVIAILFMFRARLAAEIDRELKGLQDIVANVYQMSESLKLRELNALNHSLQFTHLRSSETKDLESAFSNLTREIYFRESRIKDLIAQKLQRQAAEALGQITLKVAHDLRGPLSALKIISHSLQHQSQFHDLMKAAISRIDIIAEDILKTGKTRSNPVIDLKDCVRNLVKEKEVANPNLQFELSLNLANTCTLDNSTMDLPRMLSNLIQNSVEASSSGKKIDIRVHERSEELIFEIEDRGKGIPCEILEKIGTEGFSHDKPDGNGVGVFWAKTFIESMHGNLRIESLPNYGTTVKFALPRRHFRRLQSEAVS